MDERTMHARSLKNALIGLAAMVVVGLSTGSWTVKWVREALANARFANDQTSLGQLPFLTPVMAALISGILTLCCLLMAYYFLQRYRSLQKLAQRKS